MVFRLSDFDDFAEVAEGCIQIFYSVNETSRGKEYRIYAGRVCWIGTFEHADSQKQIDGWLKDHRAKLVEGEIELEAIFRK